MISASQLYDFVKCPHRIALDSHGDPSRRDEPNEFVELLWEQGVTHEEEIVADLPITTNLRSLPPMDRERETILAIQSRSPLIYGGRLTTGDLVGEPDLLELRGNGYIPGDIKSGSGFEGDEDAGKLKKHYAFQLAHYVVILEKTGFSDGSKEAFVIDRQRDRIAYLLTEPQGIRNKTTWWESYQEALESVRAIVGQTNPTLSAMTADCKLCHWHSHCRQDLISRDDLTLIAELGRSKRDAMMHAIPTVKALARVDPVTFVRGKKTDFHGIGPDSLTKFCERAKLLSTPGATPALKSIVVLPMSEKEIYFDIEADPMRDFVYLHGFVERMHGRPDTARFIPMFADRPDPTEEEAIFQRAWTYLRDRTVDSTIYYYSKYERTAYKKLAEKYPRVCSVSDVEELFAKPAMIDLLYDVVAKSTEWPTYDRSIKTLAQYLGFKWRDTHPSGAASIEWYHRWVETSDPAIKQRILDYNEDDCLATGVLVDGIRAL